MSLEQVCSCFHDVTAATPLLDNAVKERLIAVSPTLLKVCLLYSHRSTCLDIVVVRRDWHFNAAEHVAFCLLGILHASSEADIIRGCASLHDCAHSCSFRAKCVSLYVLYAVYSMLII